MGQRVLNESKRREICAILNVGGSRGLAARYVGCRRRTIRDTARLDRGFARRLKRAESMHELVHLKNLNSAAADARHWRAAAWMLERKYPQRWAARGPTTVTPEEMTAMLDRIAEFLCAEVTPDDARERLLQRLMGVSRGLSVADVASSSDDDDAVHDDSDYTFDQSEYVR